MPLSEMRERNNCNISGGLPPKSAFFLPKGVGPPRGNSAQFFLGFRIKKIKKNKIKKYFRFLDVQYYF